MKVNLRPGAQCTPPALAHNLRVLPLRREANRSDSRSRRCTSRCRADTCRAFSVPNHQTVEKKYHNQTTTTFRAILSLLLCCSSSLSLSMPRFVRFVHSLPFWRLITASALCSHATNGGASCRSSRRSGGTCTVGIIAVVVVVTVLKSQNCRLKRRNL